MGKRTSFEKIPKDKWPTPYNAVEPLLPFLAPKTHYIEPCANDAILIRHLARHGHRCVGALDIEPRHPQVTRGDATRARWANPPMFITNLPWSRPILHRLIEHLSAQAVLWTIIDADWMHTGQASEYLAYCTDVITIGRQIWVPGTDVAGYENAAWYRFDRKNPGPFAGPIYHGPDSKFLRDRRNAATA